MTDSDLDTRIHQQHGLILGQRSVRSPRCSYIELSEDPKQPHAPPVFTAAVNQSAIFSTTLLLISHSTRHRHSLLAMSSTIFSQRPTFKMESDPEMISSDEASTDDEYPSDTQANRHPDDEFRPDGDHGTRQIQRPKRNRSTKSYRVPSMPASDEEDDLSLRLRPAVVVSIKRRAQVEEADRIRSNSATPAFKKAKSDTSAAPISAQAMKGTPVPPFPLQPLPGTRPEYPRINPRFKPGDVALFTANAANNATVLFTITDRDFDDKAHAWSYGGTIDSLGAAAKVVLLESTLTGPEYQEGDRISEVVGRGGRLEAVVKGVRYGDVGWEYELEGGVLRMGGV